MSLRAVVSPVGRSRTRYLAVLSVMLVLVAGCAWVGYRQWRDRPPFPASAVHATATVRFTERSRFEQDARSIGADGLGAYPAGRPEDRMFVGRLAHRTPAGSGDGDFYHVIVLDKRGGRAAGLGNVISGRPSYLGELSERYPWLPAVAGVNDQLPWFVEVPANRPGPVTFAGGLPDAARLTEGDLMVVLVLLRADGHIYWAERVAG